MYWGGKPACNFRNALSTLESFLEQLYQQHHITDQVLFGDRRPVHLPAVERAKHLGIRTHVFEEGYFRPHWITLEREGTNARSLLPRDPEWFRKSYNAVPEPVGVVPFSSPFRTRAVHDVTYHLAGMVNPVMFPAYRTHSPVKAPVEYAAYIKRFSILQGIRKREHARVRALIESNIAYYVLPLQLNSDVQIRENSSFADMQEVITYVLRSFALHAPANSKIVIKNHPLDMGLMDYKKIIDECETRFGIVGRTVYLEDGDLVSLLKHARGLVTVNSTVGMVALEESCPTLTLSDPLYNIPGLTSPLKIDDFWRWAEAPDASFYGVFKQVVMVASQINGGFYCRAGIDLAVKNSARVLTANQSPLEQLMDLV